MALTNKRKCIGFLRKGNLLFKMDLYNKGVKAAIRQCMDLKRNESILIVTDKNKEAIAKLFLEEAQRITKKCQLEIISIGKIHGQEPPKYVAKLMKKFACSGLICAAPYWVPFKPTASINLPAKSPSGFLNIDPILAPVG